MSIDCRYLEGFLAEQLLLLIKENISLAKIVLLVFLNNFLKSGFKENY